MGLRVLAFVVVAALQGCASTSSPPSPAIPPSGILSAGEQAADAALAMLGAPYVFGGATPAAGFDCSGLVQFSFRQAGVGVPRTAAEQLRASARIDLRGARRGDLLFFHLEGRRNSHVAIYLGGGEFVHAPSTSKTVRTDRIASPYWRARLSSARRIAA